MRLRTITAHFPIVKIQLYCLNLFKSCQRSFYLDIIFNLENTCIKCHFLKYDLSIFHAEVISKTTLPEWCRGLIAARRRRRKRRGGRVEELKVPIDFSLLCGRRSRRSRKPVMSAGLQENRPVFSTRGF
jgi:hypothetical protein